MSFRLAKQIEAVDLNLDGTPDLVVASDVIDPNELLPDRDVAIRLGNGDGTFQPVMGLTAGDQSSETVTTDLNLDGIPDIAVANTGSDDVSVLLGNGNGTFQDQRRFAVGDLPFSIKSGDVNNDNIPDLITGNFGSLDISVLLGTGDGTFQPQQRFITGDKTNSIAIADLNLDGFQDVVALEEGATVIGRSSAMSVLLHVPEDFGTVAPTATVMLPSPDPLIEGSRVLATIDATDDVGVAFVEFLVDGQVVFRDTSGPPYEFTFTVPLGAVNVTFGARATDYAGNVGMATDLPVIVVPDPLPSISITDPPIGTTVIEGTTLTISADASDNVSVESVVFSLNGQAQPADTMPPYAIDAVVPSGSTTLTIEVTATDNLGQMRTDARDVNVIPDPLTTVIGTIVDPGDLPVEGATVTTIGGLSSTSNPDGTFSILGVPTIRGDIIATARATIGGSEFAGSSNPVAPVSGGNTDVGNIVIRSEELFSDPLDDTFGFSPVQHDIISVTVEPQDPNVLMTVTFADSIEPPDEEAQRSVFWRISFDLDQDEATGDSPFIDVVSPHGPTMLGEELSLTWFNAGESGVQASFDESSFTLTIPLELLGGDSNFNFAVLASSFFGEDNTDVAPNGGFYSIPSSLNSDGDLLLDMIEAPLGLNLFDSDTDEDGVPDDQEDTDGDGLSNIEEVTLGSDPGNPDTDGDGLLDAVDEAPLGP